MNSLFDLSSRYGHTDQAARESRERLERELADITSESELRDLGATSDRYPDEEPAEVGHLLFAGRPA